MVPMVLTHTHIGCLRLHNFTPGGVGWGGVVCGPPQELEQNITPPPPRKNRKNNTAAPGPQWPWGTCGFQRLRWSQSRDTLPSGVWDGVHLGTPSLLWTDSRLLKGDMIRDARGKSLRSAPGMKHMGSMSTTRRAETDASFALGSAASRPMDRLGLSWGCGCRKFCTVQKPWTLE